MNQQAAAAPSEWTPVQQKLLTHVDWLPGENIAFTIQGDGFFQGSNPMAKAIAAIQASLVKMTGGHIRIFVVVTNQRIVMVQSQAVWCGFSSTKAVNAIALASLAECGWAKDTRWFCIHSRAVHLESKTQRYSLVIKKLGDPALRQFVAQLSAVMLANVQSRTAT
jgi:hypothetical protein